MVRENPDDTVELVSPCFLKVGIHICFPFEKLEFGGFDLFNKGSFINPVANLGDPVLPVNITRFDSEKPFHIVPGYPDVSLDMQGVYYKKIVFNFLRGHKTHKDNP